MYGGVKNPNIIDDRPTLIYCRESRDENCDNYERIEVQRDILMKFCERRGLINVVDIIMDDDISGTSFKRFKPIIERIQRKEVQVMVFKDSSRLGRNLRESLNFVDFLETCGAEIIFESEEYDEDFFPLKAWFNEQRAKEDSLKIRRVLKHKMEEGTLLVKPKYGYQRSEENKNLMVPREDTAAVVQWIFREVRKGRGFCEMCAELNRKGIPTPSQVAGIKGAMSCWVAQHIRRIIMDPVYTGVMIYNRKTTKSFKNKKIITRPEEEWIVIEHHHEPLVTQEEFDDAQEIRRKVKYTKPTKKNRPFSGILQCGRCGHSLVLRLHKNRPDAYICGKNHKEGAIKDHIRTDYGCNAHHVRESFLYAVTKRYIQQLLQTSAVDLKDIICQVPQERSIDHRLEDLQNKLEQVQKNISRIYDDRLRGIISESLFTAKYKEYSEIENSLQQQIRQIPKQPPAAKKLTDLQLQDIINYLDECSLTKEQLHMVFDRIIVYEPQEIQEEMKEQLRLTQDDFDLIREKGGIVFVENAAPPIGIMAP